MKSSESVLLQLRFFEFKPEPKYIIVILPQSLSIVVFNALQDYVFGMAPMENLS